MTIQTALPEIGVIPPVWSRYTNLIVDRGEGCWLVTDDGVRYLDYTSGIGVTSTGHAHPRVSAAIAEQASKLIHGQQNIVYHKPGLRLYKRLGTLMPGGDGAAFLSNSGAEAVEASIKLARIATGRPVVIAFRYGFHGRTAQTMALTSSRVGMRGDFEPLPGSVYHAAFPYCYRASGGAHDPASCTCDWEEQLELLFAQLVAPNRIAAIICESVMGEGGYIVPPPGFWPRLREIADRIGALLIADEVQSGFGRTGEMFAIQHWNVAPDIIVMAKGIASGLPLSGILARRGLLEKFPPGTHGGTYGGNVVACAAAMATLDVIEDEGLLHNARTRGKELLDGLRRIAGSTRTVGDVRGLGLMLAMEFVDPSVGDGRPPNPKVAARVQAEAFARNLLVLPCGTFGNVIRLIPPLVTTASEVEFALGALTEAVAAADA
jgi:4-aminobutyrate aminotransferase